MKESADNELRRYVARDLIYGHEPGLRFGCVLDGKGGAANVDWASVRSWRPEHGVLWVHIERDHDEAARWLRQESGIDAVNCDALLAEDSRPRVEDIGDALFVVLRGINVSEHEELVPIHIWVDAHRIVTLRDRTSFLSALRDIREDLTAGKGPTTSGKLFVKILRKIVKPVPPLLAEIDDEVDDLDEQIAVATSSEAAREKVSAIRRRAIHIRRYLAPQREALARLQHEEVSWLTNRERVHLREVADLVQRLVETLDMIRDRTTILHEDMAAITAEKIAKTSNRLTALAAVLLPPSLIAGMLGTNIGGIPGPDDPWAFGILCVVIFAFLVIEVWVLRKFRWF
ncbi:MAG: zinc transporter ZntB [Alphaproteobacteria bacterium]|nr:zinc transporter ZntB [Alphaproteobacteria bacterium]